MKYLNKSIYAFALAGMMGLWSCSQEDLLQGGDVTAPAGHPVKVTLTVSRGEAQTRTALEENAETGGLNDVWEDGDKLAVFAHDGKTYYGDLTISEGVGTDTGVFSANLNGITDGSYMLWYYDRESTKVKLTSPGSSGYPSDYRFTVDFNNQNFKSVQDLAKMDLLSKEVQLTVKNGNATVVQNYTMQAKLAFVHFKLTGINGASGTLKIYNDYNAESAIYSSAYFQATHGRAQDDEGHNLPISSYTGTHDDANTPISTTFGSSGDVYMALYPTKLKSVSAAYKLRFEYTATNGEKYTYSFENATELEPGVYYNALTSDASGTSTGIEIPLESENAKTYSWNITVDEGYEGGKKTVTKVENKPDDYEYTLPSDPTRDGYVFDGWTYNGSKVSGSSISLSKDNLNVNITATWRGDGIIRWVDLGLPSGNLWADRNLGSLAVEDAGYYVGWGDRNANMTSSNPGDYPMFSPWDNSGYTKYTNVDVEGDGKGYTVYIANIQKNNNYDTAWYKSNKSYYMPNPSDFTELYQNTTQSEITVNGVSCLKLTSKKNSNFIIIPNAGVMVGNRLVNSNEMFGLWSASCMYIQYYFADDNSDFDVATVFTNDTDTFDISVGGATQYLAYTSKSNRVNIRPIKK